MHPIRLYINRNCPNCEAAVKFFTDKGVTAEAIEIGFDPVAQAGVRAIANGQLPLPIIVSYATQEVAYGSDPTLLQRLADAVLASRAGASDSAPVAR